MSENWGDEDENESEEEDIEEKDIHPAGNHSGFFERDE